MHLIQDSRLPQTANVRLTLRISQNKKQITTVPVPMENLAIMIKRKIRGKIGHVVQIHVCHYLA